MAELVSFTDIEAALVSYLSARVNVSVSTRVPANRPSSFVRVMRVGGTRTNVVTDVPMVTFECWAKTAPDAAQLGARVRALVHALEQSDAAGVWVRRVVEVGGLQSFPDPETDTPRYQFTAQLNVRGPVA